ncbi:Ig-like domain-containing protein [Pantoea dispersa]|uniref:Ig-like domain-containing protein n=1 Tax=Pantoea dispersa TaxID=59814 RepID=UPI0028DD85EE|nr:Ig-like domain-containing protein [Pantoea dispersa]MDT8849547.1 Ig-like domain-containing protein [Pantoea dispersa]
MELFNYEEAKYLERDTNTPTFFGYAMSEIGKGGTMLITVGKETFSVDINPATGYWSWTPSTPLEDGYYNMSFQSVDKAGNVSTPSLRTLIVDTTPPAAPTLLNMYDDQGDITGSFDSGKMTDDRRPTLTGIAEKGVIVYLKEGDTVIGSAKADEHTGMWKIEPEIDLTDGQHDLTLVASETFADKVREGEPSDEFTIIIGKDGEVPVDPGGVAKIIDAIDNVGSVTGSLKSDGITDDTTPELRGSAPAGSVVRIQYRNAQGEWVNGGNAVMKGTSWSWTPNPALTEGNWQFRANAGDEWSNEFTLNIDLAPASETTIAYAWDNYGLATGMLGSSARTDDRTPTLHGRAEANSIVYIEYGKAGEPWIPGYSVQVGADGNWEFTLPIELGNGNWEFRAKSGNSGAFTPKFKLNVIDNNLAPTIDFALDNVGKTQGKLASGSVTDDTTPELQGHAEANSTVYIEYYAGNNSKVIASVTANMYGEWTFSPPKLNYGNWTFNAYTNAKAQSTFEINVRETDFTSSREDFSNGAFIIIPGTTVTLASGIKVYHQYGNASQKDSFTLGQDPIKINHEFNKHSAVHFYIEKSNYFKFEAYFGYSKYNTVSFYNEKNEHIGSIVVDKKNGYHAYEFNAPEGELISKVSASNSSWTDYAGRSYYDTFSLDNFDWGIKDNIVKSTDISLNEISTFDADAFSALDNLTVEEIFSKGTKDLFIDDGKTQLMVNGNQGDTVRLEDILPEGSEQEGWTEQTGTVTIAGSQYHVFSHGDAELLVQDGVTVNLV